MGATAEGQGGRSNDRRQRERFEVSEAAMLARVMSSELTTQPGLAPGTTAVTLGTILTNDQLGAFFDALPSGAICAQGPGVLVVLLLDIEPARAAALVARVLASID